MWECVKGKTQPCGSDSKQGASSSLFCDAAADTDGKSSFEGGWPSQVIFKCLMRYGSYFTNAALTAGQSSCWFLRVREMAEASPPRAKMKCRRNAVRVPPAVFFFFLFFCTADSQFQCSPDASAAVLAVQRSRTDC